MNANNKSTAMLVGGILLILHTGIQIYKMREYTDTTGAIYYLGFIALGIGLVSGILYISIGGAAVSALLEVYYTYINIRYVVNYGAYDGWWIWASTELLIGIALVLLIVMMISLLSKKPGSSPGVMAKLWFLPGLIVTIGYLPQLFTNIPFYFSAEGFIYILTKYACLIAGMFLSGNGLSKASFSAAYPARYGPGRQTQRHPPAPYGNAPQAPGYGRPPYGNAPQAPGYGRPPYGNAPQAPVTPARPAGAVTPVAPAYPAPSAAMTGLSTENVEAMMKYKQLLDAGIISQAEFDELKKKLLG